MSRSLPLRSPTFLLLLTITGAAGGVAAFGPDIGGPPDRRGDAEAVRPDPPPPPPQEGAGPHPRALGLTPEVLDFGEQYDGLKLTREVGLTNTSARPVAVLSINTPCGCTALVDDLPVTIPPGGRKSLTIQLSTANKVGKIDYNLDLTTDEAPARVAYRVRVTAVSRASVSVSGGDLDFGPLAPGGGKTREIVITLATPAADSAPVEIIAVPDHVDAALAEVPGPAGGPKQWRLSCTPRLAAPLREPYRGDLVVRTPSTVHPELRFLVLIGPKLAVSLSPTLASFGFVSGREPRTARVAMKPRTPGEVVEILSTTVRGESPYLAVRTEGVAASDQVDVVFSLDPAKRPAGFFKTQVEVVYRCGRCQETVVLPVEGYGYTN